MESKKIEYDFLSLGNDKEIKALIKDGNIGYITVMYINDL
jgi:hypothetical protein